MASVLKGVGGIFSSILGIGTAPKPKPSPAMPDPGNPLLLAQQKQAAAKAQGGSGRASTILSSPAGSDYSSPTLGG